MEVFRILFEPGRKASNESIAPSNKALYGNVRIYEYEFFTDIVYRVTQALSGFDNISVINPAWSLTHIKASDRTEYVNKISNQYDLLISLTFNNNIDAYLSCTIKPKNKSEQSQMLANKFSTPLTDILIDTESKSIRPIIRDCPNPAFNVEFGGIPAKSNTRLEHQITRKSIAEYIASGICSMLDLDSSKLTIAETPDVKYVGYTVCDNAIVRTDTRICSGIKIDLNKYHVIDILDTVVDDGYEWYKISYGNGYGYIDADIVHITGSYQPAVYVQTNNKTIFTDARSGVVKSLIAPIYDEKTKKMIGTLYKGATVNVLGAQGSHYIISIGSSNSLVLTKHITLKPVDNIDSDNALVEITLDELNRRGYTHVVI